MNTKDMVKEYDKLVYRTIPADVKLEWRWYQQYQAALKEDNDEHADRLAEVIEQCQRRTNAAMKKATILHRQLQGKGFHIPNTPHPHRPDL